MRTLNIGTRASPLALAQTRLVVDALQAAHPALTTNIVHVSTSADEGEALAETSLAKLGTINAFVKEIDEALLRGDIDVAVHSYKDIAIARPAGIVTAAVPPRADARDVVFFNQHSAGASPLKIGSSAPRRQHNIPPLLAEMGLEVEFVDIRGNVQTRLHRAARLPDHPQYLDGVVLALAGVLRLLADEEAGFGMSALLRKIPCVVLPLDTCPTAPAQGALAVECREDDADIRALLQAIHHDATAQHVAAERAILAQHGGGCHLALGVSSTDAFVATRGKTEDGSELFDVAGTVPHTPLVRYDNLLQHPDAQLLGIR